MGRIEKIMNFEGVQELHSGSGYASASIPFLHPFKDSRYSLSLCLRKLSYTHKRGYYRTTLKRELCRSIMTV